MNIGPESHISISLVIDSCEMMVCVRQLAINTQAWMQSDCARQRANEDGKTRLRPCYLFSY